MEDIFSEFVQQIRVSVWKRRMKLEKSDGVVSVERSGMDKWNYEQLYNKLGFVQLVDNGLEEVTQRWRRVYYKPSSFGQRMYDAIVMPSDRSETIDLIQITLAANHSVACEEFKELFRKFGRRKFRYIMIRVAITKKEVEKVKATKMRCGFVCAEDMLKRLRTDVEFYECVLDLETCLKKWVEVIARTV
jgi:hypothetical protein